MKILNIIVGVCAVGIIFCPQKASAEGLIRSIWSCQIPCQSGDGKFMGSVRVSYCSVSTLSPAMIKTLDPICKQKTGRSDAVAARSIPEFAADCVSSSNTCAKEGLVRAGYTCNLNCPSEDSKGRKYTVCASTGDEAWSYATEICKDAKRPDRGYFAQADVCVADGQTPCD